MANLKQNWQNGQTVNAADYNAVVKALNAANTKIASVEEEITALNLDGIYSKPETGIPKSHLVAAVRTSLGKADTALQSVPPIAVEDLDDVSEVGVAVFTGDAAAGRTALETLGLVQAAKNPDLLVTGAVTVDGSDLITSAAVLWPDNSPGTLTITSRDANSAVLAYNITYGSPVTKTFTQPSITRNANGAATNVPAIVVS